MSTNTTPYLGLSQWEGTDPVLREDFNRDNSKLDTAYRSIPMLAAGSYTGTGAYGPDQVANQLLFGFSPQLVVVVPDSELSLHGALILIRDQSAFNGLGFLSSSSSGLGLSVSWGMTSVSWRCSHGGSPDRQFNDATTTYRYFAIGSKL